ncbi:MAG: glycoside hydrolase [Chloroflexota bacterium]|nr:glycoside hydrolase [Chloroflexota bacterium]
MNIQVSHDTYAAHSEPMLVEDPKNPLHLVGGSKFFTDPKHYRFKIGYFSSFDGGCTWMDGGVFSGFGNNVLTSDVSFAFGPHDEVYAAILNTDVGFKGESGISVFTSKDGGESFGLPVNVFSVKAHQVFSDKPWITVDLTRGPYSGTIYVVWDYDHGGDCGDGNLCKQELAFSRSTNEGKTFSQVQLVEGNAPFCTNPAKGRPVHSTICDAALGSIPVVLPNGTIAITSMYIDLMSGHIPSRLMVTTSPDSGITWTSPVLAATISDIIGIFPPEKYRNLSLPAFACDPRTGQLYIVWADKATGDADILLITSKDSGKTWSAPIRVNDDPLRNGANQFQPQLVVAPNGVVNVSFFDTRVDAHHRLIDVYLAQSIDAGISFLQNVHVTTQSWDPRVDAPIDSSGLQFIGDYQGLAADNHFVHPFWNDTRTGKQEIFTAAVPGAQPKGK